MSQGKSILKGFRKRWQLMQSFEMLLYATGPALLFYFLSSNIILSLSVFASIVLLGLVLIKPWKLTLEKIGNYIDKNLDAVEYSTGLLLLPENQLSGVARLQRHKVSETLQKSIHLVRPKVALKQAVLVLGAFGLLTFFAQQFNWTSLLAAPESTPEVEQRIAFKPLDSIEISNEAPQLEHQKLLIRYPSYTRIGTISTTNMNVKALEGSILTWKLKFDRPIQSVVLESSNDDHSMRKSDGEYSHQMLLSTAGFYNFNFEALDGASYQSELYALEMFKDERPTVDIQKLKQFTSFDFDEDKTIAFETMITDDYGIMDAHIIATVSKGEGESVKFREQRLHFNNALLKGSKNQKLSKRIDLDEMGMEPGDELYFYIAVTDNKEPKANTTRSETYFAVIRDTLSSQFAVEGTMGADLMPDYFRSQRQLIIDTEKLIANKSKLPQKEFNFTSNELGFDQKALRLKYGEFMGDEAESGIQVAEAVTEETEEEENNEDPLSEYTHDHDGSNEHNLVDHEHEEEGEDEQEEDPLESYLHNHDDPEESTLFTQSLKSKLRQAMTEMWDAELYLRLYTPEKSLPYQYRALKLIQEIKNSARIYVHRIGFDPPPIKEDKRLTGELEEVVSFQKQVDLAVPEEFPFMKKAVERLEQLTQGRPSEEADKNLFSAAGNELAALAILEPGKYLKTLQQLKWMSDSNEYATSQLYEVLRGLKAAIPKPKSKPKRLSGYHSELNTLLLKELEIND